MSPAIRRQLATAYTRMLRMSTTAEKRGLDKGPKFDEMLYFARMQILSQELSRALQEDAGKVTDGDIDDYYKKNKASYEQASFARIFVPRAKQIVNPVVKPKVGAKAGAKATPTTSTNKPPTEAQKKASEEAMTKLAAALRARAAKGEDPDKLQKEAYTAAGLPGNAPSTKMEKVRRTTLPVNHQAVMDLKPGDVSEVISDPNSGHYIYKLVSKETLSVDTVKTEIRSTISSQRYRDSMQGFQGNVELNDAYSAPLEILPCRHCQGEPSRLPNKSKTQTEWIQQNQPSSSPGFRAILASGSCRSSRITRWWASMSRPQLIPRLIGL